MNRSNWVRRVRQTNLKSCHSSSTAPINGAVGVIRLDERESVAMKTSRRVKMFDNAITRGTTTEDKQNI